MNKLTRCPSSRDHHIKMLHATHQTVLVDFPVDRVQIHWILRCEVTQIHHFPVEHRDDTRKSFEINKSMDDDIFNELDILLRRILVVLNDLYRFESKELLLFRDQLHL